MYEQSKRQKVDGDSSLLQNQMRFTLIELLVCIVIIAMLAALLMPALAKARYRAKVVICLGNQKQVAGGLTMYADDYDSYYPAPVCKNCPCNDGSHYPIDGQMVRGVERAVNVGRNIVHDDSLDYYGGWGGAKGIFMCPLIEGEYASKIDNYESRFPYGPLVPFALFFNYGGPKSSTPFMEKPMRRVGDSWKIRKRGGDWRIQYNSSEKESNILVGDYLGRRNWPENFSVAAQYVNHNVPGRAIIDVVSHGSGWYVNYWTYAPTSGNFILNDLSGATYNELHWKYRTDTTGGFMGYTGDSQGGIVPLELLE